MGAVAKFVCFLAIAGAWSTGSVGNATELRVAIVKEPSFSIKGMDLMVKDAAGRPVPLPDAYTEVPVKLSRGRISIGGREVHGEPLILESRSVYFRIAGRQYRGQVHVYVDGDRLLAVNRIELEDYLVGLINHEVSSAWSLEAVKAQAVVARTYALFQAGNSRDPRFDLESTVADQVYAGSQTEDYRSAKAVRETAGVVMVDAEGNVVQAFYCSSCGGITELPQNVWGTTTPIKTSVVDPWCAGAPNSTWTFSIGTKEMGDDLRAGGYAAGQVSAVTILRKTAAERVTKLRITSAGNPVEMSGNELRRVLGYGKLKSARFTVTLDEAAGKVVFRGRGAGHGVGMCQWGAKGMAEAGYSYRQILGQYYPGMFLRQMDRMTPKTAARRP